jgi:hypothetical protein
MGKVIINRKADESAFRILQDQSLWSQEEVAKIYSRLLVLQEKITASIEFWNVEDSASGILESCHTVNGTPVWRLCPPGNRYIALLAVYDDDLVVLDICQEANADAVERELTTIEVERLIKKGS